MAILGGAGMKLWQFIFTVAVLVAACLLISLTGCGPLIRVEKVEFSPDIDVKTGPLSGITVESANENGNRGDEAQGKE